MPYYCLNAVLIFCMIAQSKVITGEWLRNGPVEYLLSNNTSDIAFAKSQCRSMKAELATLSNKANYLYVRNNIPNEGNTLPIPRRGFYVNARRSKLKPNTFLWSDNISFPNGRTEKWGGFQPSDLPSENCVIIDEKWVYNVNCTNTSYNYICQRIVGSFWTSWENWSTCSSTCIVGSRKRIRRCTKLEDKGMHYCNSAITYTETEPCNTNLCNETLEHTTQCNASCGEVSSSYKSLICKYNVVLHDQCKNLTNHSCIGNCPTTTDALPTATKQKNESSNRKATTELTTTEITTSEPFIRSSFGIIIGGSVAGLIVILFIIFLILVAKRGNKSNAKSNKIPEFYNSGHLPNDSGDFNRHSSKTYQNVYEVAKYTSGQQVSIRSKYSLKTENPSVAQQHRMSDHDYGIIENVVPVANGASGISSANDTMERILEKEPEQEVSSSSNCSANIEGTNVIQQDCVTAHDYGIIENVCPDTNDATVRPSIDEDQEVAETSSVRSADDIAKEPENDKSDHKDAPKFICQDGNDDIGSYVSIATVDKMPQKCKSAHTSKPAQLCPSTLEFDYVTVENVTKKDPNEYGKLNVQTSPIKPYSQTYDSLQRTY